MSENSAHLAFSTQLYTKSKEGMWTGGEDKSVGGGYFPYSPITIFEKNQTVLRGRKDFRD